MFGMIGKIVLVLCTVGAIFLGIKLKSILDVPIPKLGDTWWGPGRPSTDVDVTIKPFKIDVPEKVIKDLKRRLNNTRDFTPPLEGVQQQYGMNTKLLGEIVDFWKTKYDWREREKFLNKYPQFTTNIQGLDIHFVHVKPRNVPSGIKILPLLMLHGWPGSFREFYQIIPMLTELDAHTSKHGFIFEVIAPSLPGYGFSKPGVKPGLGPSQMSVVLKNLMLRLGFDRFYLQGGDWGSLIISHMSALFPQHILGTHSNMCQVLTPMGLLKHLLVSPSILGKLPNLFGVFLMETGYMHIQATKPDTIGVALNDSPVGLAAYILEKFTTGTNPEYKKREDGGLKLKFSYTDLLDNVMIYWVSNSMTTAMRVYSEFYSKSQMELKVDMIPVEVPYACAKFPREIVHMPDNVLSTRYKNLVHSAEFEDGGHFAAFEVPKLLAEDVWTAVRKMEKL